MIRSLTEIEIVKIPRKWRLPLATLCRRVAQIPLGLKILAPVIAPEKNGTPPSSSELAEYAALLQKFGAVDDALRLLARVDLREVPEALMYKAVCHFSRWEYGDAVPLLESYVDLAVSSYQGLVGRVNLAAALIGTLKFDDAEKLLEENIRIARESQAARLEGNCHELLTQVHLMKRDLVSASRCLEVAETLLVGPQSLDRLFTNKCRAYLTALETRSTKSLLEFRREAVSWPHAETVRETDLFTLMIEPIEELHDTLYFGTPFKGYRSRMEALLGQRQQKTQYILGAAEDPCFDIASGESPFGDSLKPGSSVHKVIGALLRDFYRPARFGSLFGQLFPNEHFDIHSSPARVHQSLRRARRWLLENRVPAEIKETNGTYKLEITGAVSFRLLADRENLGRHGLLLAQLSSAFPRGEPFTAAAACEKLEMTTSSFHRFLQPMLESGRVEKFGASTSTVYFVPAA